MSRVSDDELAGKVIGGRYRVTEKLAAGGMGVVYRAERLHLGRAVAIKFLRRVFVNEDSVMRRFETEAKAMGRLAHPHCVSVLDFGIEDGLPYLVMDFVHGKTLRELIDQGALPLPRALAVFRQILAGVAHAHGQGIVHRDLKPANIMLSEATGTGDHVRVLDFGLAKLREPGADASVTALAVGTPSYMAPEQARSEAVNNRTDVYSLGVLLFELVTGEKPFFSDQAFEVIQMHVNMPPPKLTQKARVSQALEDLVTRAMAKAPEARFQTVRELAEALAATPEATGALRPPTTLPPADDPPMAPRNRTGTVALVTLLVAGVALLGWVAMSRRATAPAPDATLQVASVTSAPAEPDAAPPDAPPPPVPDAAPPDAAPPVPPDAAPPDAPPLPDADAGPEEEEVPDEQNEPVPEVAATPVPDEEIDETPPPPPTTAPEVRTIKEAQALIAAGRRGEAITALQRLRPLNPKSAYIPYLLGNLYFDRKWWSDGLESYRSAIRLNRAYRGRAVLVRNAIRALSSKKTYRRAQTLLRKDVGSAGAPYLRTAARGDPSPIVRTRAATLLKQVSKRR